VLGGDLKKAKCCGAFLGDVMKLSLTHLWLVVALL